MAENTILGKLFGRKKSDCCNIEIVEEQADCCSSEQTADTPETAECRCSGTDEAEKK